MNPSAAPWRVRRAAPCLCGLRLRIAFTGIKEVSTGLGIDAAIDLGMAVGSAAGAVLALRDVRSIAVLNDVEKS
jgi:hypothetical protein